MYNDFDYDYKAKIEGKDFFLKLNSGSKTLYSWESAAAHLAEGAGGSATFQEFKESESWQNWIRRTFGTEILAEVLQKIKEAVDPN